MGWNGYYLIEYIDVAMVPAGRVRIRSFRTGSLKNSEGKIVMDIERAFRYFP
jgi:hypothetical protein